MRYLKSYKIFESIEPDLKEVEQDVSDMLLDIQDEGLTVKVIGHISFEIESDKGSWPHLFDITDNIKDTLERISEYISEKEYGINISFSGPEYIELLYENGRWIDLDDHKDIELIGRQASLIMIEIYKIFENNTDESFIETLKDICFDITDNLPLRCDVESGYMVLRVVISNKKYERWNINSIIIETIKRMIYYMDSKYTIQIVDPKKLKLVHQEYKIEETENKKLKPEEYLVIEFTK